MLIVLACLLADALYLFLTRFVYHRFGYPLDDAWIYQTYARNLARTGQWAFVPGLPSTGSTSILWTLLLTPVYWLPIDPRWGTHALGLLTLTATALGSARLFKEDALGLSLAVGLGVALEWHLVWAAASGMETGLFAALLIWFWVWLRRHDPIQCAHRWHTGLLAGIWGGILMLARPEGVLALGVAGLYGLLAPSRSGGGMHLGRRLVWAMLVGVGFALFLVPFFAFNHAISGAWWPNTFYAKQTEYAVLYRQPYLLRLFEQMATGWIGAQVLLLPALLVSLWVGLRRRTLDGVSLAPLGWALLHWALYAARLPVTYQHGRYAIPAIPVILIFGVRGMAHLIQLRSERRLLRFGSLVWTLSVVVLFPLMLGILGAPAYARDVSFIEDEMVATARWVDENVPPDAIIAAHDIGALGYFAPRRLVDLAGLVSPAVIPFMRDADHLTAYILMSGSDYLIIFPHWSAEYELIVSSPHFCPVWSADRGEGYSNPTSLGPMTVYEVRPAGDCPTPPPTQADGSGQHPLVFVVGGSWVVVR
jgi:hypothetical protein